jgi:hypothetical protein
MSPEGVPWCLDAAPPANLADLVSLRRRQLSIAPAPHPGGDRSLSAGWERWQAELMRLVVRFQAHPCLGRRCARCGEFYALLQVLEHRKRQLLHQHGERGTGPS